MRALAAPAATAAINQQSPVTLIMPTVHAMCTALSSGHDCSPCGVSQLKQSEVRRAHLYWYCQQRRQKQDGCYPIQRGAPARQCLGGLPAPEVQALPCAKQGCCAHYLCARASRCVCAARRTTPAPHEPSYAAEFYLNDEDANRGKPLQLEPGCLQSRAWTCVPVSQGTEQCHAACRTAGAVCMYGVYAQRCL